MHFKQCHHLMIFTYLQCPLRRKPLLLRAPTDVVEDVDVAVVTATMTTVTTATIIIIMMIVTTVDVTVDATKPFKGLPELCLNL